VLLPDVELAPEPVVELVPEAEPVVAPDVPVDVPAVELVDPLPVAPL
jgi:hypothetical protein